MIAFDADVLSEILAGDPALAAKAAEVPPGEQAVPIVVVEEILRGRLNAIRRAEAGKSKISVHRAYALFDETLDAFRQVAKLPYSEAADILYQQWRSKKIRGGTHDLRIAAICVAHAAKLITRNRRDFENFPGLSMEVW
jgi:tRNA(fMet)-specific endonuclease VapC